MSNVNGLWLPNDHTWRDLWLARNNVGAELRQSVNKEQAGMHDIDLTNLIAGQERRTTCEGVHFDGSVNTEIDCGAVNSNVAKFWVSLRFKLDQDFSTASANDLYIFGKRLNVTDYIYISLTASNGKLQWYQRAGGAQSFELFGDTVSWAAGTWYHVLCSLSDTAPSQRMLVNGIVENTDTQAANNVCNGGNMRIGNFRVTNTNGMAGVISDVFIGTDDLTTQEETNLYLGIPPVDAVNAYRLTEGKESTAYDEGSGVDIGTLDATATWAWGGCRQPVIGFAGIDQYGRTPVYQKGNGDLTMVWIGKLKSPYLGLQNSMNYAMFCNIWIDADNRLEIYYDQANDEIRGLLEGVGTTITADGFESPFSYNDYAVMMVTCGVDGAISLFANGELVSYNSGAGAIPGINGRFNLQASSGGANYNVSDVLACGIINGVIDTDEAREITKRADDQLNMGVKLL